jgi:membrane-associated phospholipid phosphatase
MTAQLGDPDLSAGGGRFMRGEPVVTSAPTVAAVTADPSRLAAGAVVAAVASLPATPLRAVAQRADRRALSWVVDHRRPAWRIPARRLTALAKPTTVVPVLAACAGWATFRGVPVRRVGHVLGVAGAGIAARRLLEETVRRSRPPSDWWWQQPSGYSYPSKHVTWAVLGYGAAADLVGDGRPPARGLAIAVSAVVAGTRLVLAEHWPSDVCAAFGLALAMRRLLGR